MQHNQNVSKRKRYSRNRNLHRVVETIPSFRIGMFAISYVVATGFSAAMQRNTVQIVQIIRVYNRFRRRFNCRAQVFTHVERIDRIVDVQADLVVVAYFEKAF
jgi:hypothetical protein